MFTLLKPIGKFVLRKLIRKASPEIRSEFRDFVLNKLEAKARATENKWDDFLIDLLKIVLK